MYIKNDIPALKMSDGKLWWKSKTYKSFATKSCGLSNKEYEDVIQNCIYAIKKTKIEIKEYSSKDENIKEFLDSLQECWVEEI